MLTAADEQELADFWATPAQKPLTPSISVQVTCRVCLVKYEQTIGTAPLLCADCRRDVHKTRDVVEARHIDASEQHMTAWIAFQTMLNSEPRDIQARYSRIIELRIEAIQKPDLLPKIEVGIERAIAVGDRLSAVLEEERKLAFIQELTHATWRWTQDALYELSLCREDKSYVYPAALRAREQAINEAQRGMSQLSLLTEASQ